MISQTSSGMFLMGMGEFTLPIHLAHAPTLASYRQGTYQVPSASSNPPKEERACGVHPRSSLQAVPRQSANDPPGNIYLPGSPSSHLSAIPNTSHSKPPSPAPTSNTLPCPRKRNLDATHPPPVPAEPVKYQKPHANRQAATRGGRSDDGRWWWRRSRTRIGDRCRGGGGMGMGKAKAIDRGGVRCADSHHEISPISPGMSLPSPSHVVLAWSRGSIPSPVIRL